MSDDIEVSEDITEDTDTTELDETTQENLRKLRSESKNLRDRAKAAEARADELARALFTARVTATGLVANAAEIPFDANALDDADALTAAIETAIADRPYIKARRVSGDAGQGERGNITGPKDFSGLFR